MQESVTFTRMYLNRVPDTSSEEVHPATGFNLSVVSTVVDVKSLVRNTQLTKEEMFWAHWTVVENCEEADVFIQAHSVQYRAHRPNGTLRDRIESFNYNFRTCVSSASHSIASFSITVLYYII